jgi:hypothetical protein
VTGVVNEGEVGSVSRHEVLLLETRQRSKFQLPTAWLFGSWILRCE